MGFVLGAITALSATFGGGALATTIATAVVRLTAGLLVTAVASLFQDKPSSPKLRRSADVRQEAKRISSQPPKRTAYGHFRVPGLLIPGDAVNEDSGFQYGFYLLQSRPSAGTNLTIYLDNRELTLTGDIFDFTGPGAEPEEKYLNDGFVKFWLGLGDQTAPPDQIMSEFGDATATNPFKFWPSDAGTGLTILWFRYKNGKAEDRQKRWPNYPRPEIDVEMDWSLVPDPRDPTHDMEDPSTWTFSENQGRCLLDAVLTNPVARRTTEQIRMADFIEAANVADEARERADGSQEPAYRVGGLIVWQNATELLEQLEPLAQAGAGQMRRAGGKLGYAAGKYYPPSATLSQPLSDARIVTTPRKSSRDVPKALRPVYPDPQQDYEDGDLPVIPVEGRNWVRGQDEVEKLNLSLVPYWPQAQRIGYIEARRAARQMTMTATFAPETIDLLPGASVQVAFPDGGARNRVWKVQNSSPADFMEDPEGTLAFSNPLSLIENPEAIYAHDPADEEEPERIGEVDTTSSDIPVPVNVQSFPQIISGQSSIGFSFESPAAPDVGSFTWRYRVNGGLAFAGGDIDEGSALSDEIFPVVVGSSYVIEVRTNTARGVSDYEASNESTAVNPTISLPTPAQPTIVFTTETSILVEAKVPNSNDVKGLRFYSNSVDDTDSATQFGSDLFGSANQALSQEETGLSPEETRFYWTRAIGPYDSLSDFSPVVSATTDASGS